MGSKLDPFVHVLGTMPDAHVAYIAGCSREFVRQQRNKRGIKLCVNSHKIAGKKFQISQDAQNGIRLLGGQLTDVEIAAKYKISKVTAGKYRRRFAIKRASMPTKFNWTAELLALMGQVSDKEMARLAGCCVMTAFRKRKSLGIPMRADKRRKAA